jgi:hypothetical protein
MAREIDADAYAEFASRLVMTSLPNAAKTKGSAILF